MNCGIYHATIAKYLLVSFSIMMICCFFLIVYQICLVFQLTNDGIRICQLLLWEIVTLI